MSAHCGGTRSAFDSNRLNCGRGSGYHKGSHHVVVFVVKDMAVPYVVAFDVEGGFDERDRAGVADDSILASGFTGFRGQHRC